MHDLFKHAVRAVGGLLGLGIVAPMLTGFGTIATQSFLLPNWTLANIVGVTVGIWLGDFVVKKWM